MRKLLPIIMLLSHAVPPNEAKEAIQVAVRNRFASQDRINYDLPAQLMHNLPFSKNNILINDVWIMILQYGAINDLLAISACNKEWNLLAHSYIVFAHMKDIYLIEDERLQNFLRTPIYRNKNFSSA